MDSTEARDKAALVCVPDIYRQTERGINYSEGGREEWPGRGVIHWSVWLIRGLWQRGQKTTAVDSMAASHLQTSGEHFTSLTFIREQPHLGSITATSAWPPNMLVRTNYTIAVLKWYFNRSVYPNCIKRLLCFTWTVCNLLNLRSQLRYSYVSTTFTKPNTEASLQTVFQLLWIICRSLQ